MPTLNSLTTWLKQSYHSRGLDPLGVQAPSINIYGKLLPGVTNVTDRARYYSFYPWMIRAFQNHSDSKTYSSLREWVRRSDCLFTMIGIRHGLLADDNNYALHAGALIGSRTLTSIVENMSDDSEVDLSDFTTLNESSTRYFQNHFGGLKQYYLGTFDSLGLMTRQGRGVANTNEIGVPMADAMESFVESDLFIQTISEGKVSIQVLDELNGFCPCQLLGSGDEHEALLNLFFARSPFDDDFGRQRRSSFGLILNLIRQMSESEIGDIIFNQEAFRACVYTGALPDGSIWSLPQGLTFTRNQWRVYQKNELFSAAIQSVFWVALRMIEESNEALWSTEEFVNWFSSHPIIQEAGVALGGTRLVSTLEHVRASIPGLEDWLNEDHEIQLVRRTLDGCDEKKSGDYATILVNAGRVILALLARDEKENEAYMPLSFPDGFFKIYPLNLIRLREEYNAKWSAMRPAEWLAWIAGHWGIEAHFRVALRKLRFQNKDTLHVLPTDHGFVVQEMPSPTYTTPRFKQATQILEDIGAIAKSDDHSISLTMLGEELREEIHG